MRTKTKILAIVCCLAYLVSSCGSSSDQETLVVKTKEDLVQEARAQVNEIGLDEFKELYDGADYYLIDVRTQSEHNSGYIPGSISIPRGVLEFRVENEAVWDAEFMYVPNKEDLVIIYCKSGSRSVLCAVQLKKMGYSNVKSISGGWVAWKDKFPGIYEVSAAGAGGHVEEAGGC